MAFVPLMPDGSNRTTATSYVRFDQAQTYFQNNFDRISGLDFAQDAVEGALVTAGQLMNQLPWDGAVAFSSAEDQLLAFPRAMTIPAARPGNFAGRNIQISVADGAPRVVMNMQIELAYHLLSNPGITTDTGGQLNNASLTAGSVELTGLRNASVIPQQIRVQLRMYLRGGSPNAVFVNN